MGSSSPSRRATRLREWAVPRAEWAKGRSSELYGALGAATTILFGLYVSARLVTIAAFLDATLWERRGSHRPAALRS